MTPDAGPRADREARPGGDRLGGQPIWSLVERAAAVGVKLSGTG
jgi:hypothetical protein